MTADQPGIGRRIRLADIHIVKGVAHRLFENPRLSFRREPLDKLRESIAALGLMKDLLVRDNDGTMELLAGERRLTCIRELVAAGATVRDIGTGRDGPAAAVYEFAQAKVITCRNDEEALQYTVAENLNSLPVTDWDMLLFVLKLNTEFDGDRGRIGRVLGRGPSYICQMLEVGNLPDDVLDRLRDGSMTKKAALELIGVRAECVAETVAEAAKVLRREAASAVAEATLEIRRLRDELSRAEAARAAGDLAAAKTATRTRQRLQEVAVRREKAEGQMASEQVTGEAVILVKAERPGVMKAGRVQRPWTPRRVGTRLKQVEAMLRQEAGAFIDKASGRVFPRRELEVMAHTYRQVMGHGGQAVFSPLAGS